MPLPPPFSTEGKGGGKAKSVLPQNKVKQTEDTFVVPSTNPYMEILPPDEED